MQLLPEKRLDGASFGIALTSAIHRVMGKQALLNEINVFPVADSDTGTNLSLSLAAALPVLAARPAARIDRLTAELADALLDGARGNSGAIMAQFFQGVSDAAIDLEFFSTTTLASAVRSGSDYAHDALSEPKQGTILSVISAFADGLERHAESQQLNVAAAVRDSLPLVDAALRRTTEQLAVLKKAGVVDAGAKGFVELVNGVSEYLSDGIMARAPDHTMLRELVPNDSADATQQDAQFRFCTECLVSGTTVDRRKLREKLSALGDSLVVAGSKRKAKIHVHVDEPERVFQTAAKFGVVSGEKVDDMHRQQSVRGKASQRFAVITDSAADIADADMERLDIHMVPCRVLFGTRGYLDKVSITADEFYAELKSNSHHPTTSQPAPADFRRQFQFLASHFDEVLSISLSSTVSGTCEAARAAAKRIEAAGKVTVIDSRSASVGQGQLAVLAAELAAAGLNAKEAQRIIEKRVAQTQTYAMLDDLEYAVRGGRLPRWVKTIADRSGLTPILSVTKTGQVRARGFLIGRDRLVERFATWVARRSRHLDSARASVGHALRADDAEHLQAALQQRISGLVDAPPIAELGSALGVHGGPGTLVVAIGPAD